MSSLQKDFSVKMFSQLKTVSFFFQGEEKFLRKLELGLKLKCFNQKLSISPK